MFRCYKCKKIIYNLLFSDRVNVNVAYCEDCYNLIKKEREEKAMENDVHFMASNDNIGACGLWRYRMYNTTSNRSKVTCEACLKAFLTG